MRKLATWAPILAAGLTLIAGPALAGRYTCPSGATYDGRNCSDGSMAVYVADEVQPQSSQPVEPRWSQPVEPRSSQPVEPRWSQPVAPRPAPQLAPQGAQGPRSLLGAWSTRVPGGVWTSPSAIPGWESLHISPGALGGLLVIYPNGTYIWNSYGGKRGSWSLTGDPEYPIALDDRAERKIWQVGLNQRRPGAIYIRESRGMYWYEGERAR